MMLQPYTELVSRLLIDSEHAEHFLKTVVSDTTLTDEEIDDAAFKVAEQEKLIGAKKPSPTINATAWRHSKYRSPDARVNLLKSVLKELIDLEQLVDDDQLRLGIGGAKPNVPVQHNKQAFIVTGLPASGKSRISREVSRRYGAYIVDSDFAKRKLPEFSFTGGADAVHEESAEITFGSISSAGKPSDCLFKYCVDSGSNIVIPKIGYSKNSIEELAQDLIAKGYDTHLTLVSVDRRIAVERALKRFLKTKRYVPLALIFDGYGNDPILTYYRTRENSIWKSTGKILNEGNDSPPSVIHCAGENPAKFFQ